MSFASSVWTFSPPADSMSGSRQWTCTTAQPFSSTPGNAWRLRSRKRQSVFCCLSLQSLLQLTGIKFLHCRGFFFAPINTVIAAIIASRIKLEEDVVLINSPLHLSSSTANGKDGFRTVCVHSRVRWVGEGWGWEGGWFWGSRQLQTFSIAYFFLAPGWDLWPDLIWTNNHRVNRKGLNWKQLQHRFLKKEMRDTITEVLFSVTLLT